MEYNSFDCKSDMIHELPLCVEFLLVAYQQNKHIKLSIPPMKEIWGGKGMLVFQE